MPKRKTLAQRIAELEKELAALKARPQVIVIPAYPARDAPPQAPASLKPWMDQHCPKWGIR
jgi:hypothetical protein